MLYFRNKNILGSNITSELQGTDRFTLVLVSPGDDV